MKGEILYKWFNDLIKGNFEIPDDLDTQYKIKDVLSRRGVTNTRLAANMIRVSLF